MLEDESDRSQFNSRGSQIGIVQHGQEYKLHFWKLLAHSLGSIESVQKGHADVNDDHVRLEPQSFGNERAPVGDSPHNGIVLLQKKPKAISENDVIVSNQYVRPGVHLSAFVLNSPKLTSADSA